MTEERKFAILIAAIILSARKLAELDDARIFSEVCSPGANVTAAWYRLSMLGLVTVQTGLVGPELSDAAKDAVCNVAASFPMKMMAPGVNDDLPLEVEAFVKQIQDELGRLGIKVDPGT